MYQFSLSGFCETFWASVLGLAKVCLVTQKK